MDVAQAGHEPAPRPAEVCEMAQRARKWCIAFDEAMQDPEFTLHDLPISNVGRRMAVASSRFQMCIPAIRKAARPQPWDVSHAGL